MKRKFTTVDEVASQPIVIGLEDEDPFAKLVVVNEDPLLKSAADRASLSEKIIKAVKEWREVERKEALALLKGETGQLNTDESDHLLHHVRILEDVARRFAAGDKIPTTRCPHCKIVLWE